MNTFMILAFVFPLLSGIAFACEDGPFCFGVLPCSDTGWRCPRRCGLCPDQQPTQPPPPPPTAAPTPPPAPPTTTLPPPLQPAPISLNVAGQPSGSGNNILAQIAFKDVTPVNATNQTIAIPAPTSLLLSQLSGGSLILTNSNKQPVALQIGVNTFGELSLTANGAPLAAQLVSGALLLCNSARQVTHVDPQTLQFLQQCSQGNVYLLGQNGLPYGQTTPPQAISQGAKNVFQGLADNSLGVYYSDSSASSTTVDLHTDGRAFLGQIASGNMVFQNSNHQPVNVQLTADNQGWMTLTSNGTPLSQLLSSGDVILAYSAGGAVALSNNQNEILSNLSLGNYELNNQNSVEETVGLNGQIITAPGQ